MLCHQMKTSSSFFGLMVDLEQSGTKYPDAWSLISTFSLIENLFSQKLKTTKKPLTQLSYYCFE